MQRTVGARTHLVAFAAVVAVLAVMISVVAFNVQTAWAGGSDYSIAKMKKTSTVKALYFPGSNGGKTGTINQLYFSGSKKVTIVKKDAKKVKVSVAAGSNINVKLKKAGTSKLVFKYGKKKYTVKIVAKKFTNPFKTLKIGNVSYKQKVKKVAYGGYYYTPMHASKSFMGQKLTATIDGKWKVTFNDGAMRPGDICEDDFLYIQAKHKATGYTFETAFGTSYTDGI